MRCPFRRFVVGEHGYLERGITSAADGSLLEADRPAEEPLLHALQCLEVALPVGLRVGDLPAAGAVAGLDSARRWCAGRCC